MGVTLSEVKRAARAHRAPLAGESAGYLVLALADQVLSAPRVIGGDDVQLTDDGGLRLLRGTASSEGEAELSLRRTLDELLLVASSGSAALMRAGRRAAPVGLATLVRELEAALIPVNRAAARRALARLHRETERALALGALPAEEPSARLPTASTSQPAASEPAAPAAATAQAAAIEPNVECASERAAELEDVAEPECAAEPEYAAEPECAAEPEYAAEPECAADPDEEATAAIALPVTLLADSGSDFCGVDGTVSALPTSEALALSLEPPPENDELTIALAVRPAVEAEPELILHEDDVEFLDEDEGDALTTVHGVEVAPIAAALADPVEVDLPPEQCTRPEPIMVRQALRASVRPPSGPTLDEALGATPTFGSLAVALPVLAPERIAELTRQTLGESAQAVGASDSTAAVPTIAVSETQAAASEPDEAAQGGAGPAPIEEYTEPMPEVSPLLPGVAIVASRKSEVSELLSGFQVSADDTHRDLRRAIKEMAELDLTPAPFSAFNR